MDSDMQAHPGASVREPNEKNFGCNLSSTRVSFRKLFFLNSACVV